MIRFLGSLFLNHRIYYLLTGLVVWLLMSYWIHALYPLGMAFLGVLVLLFLVDLNLLFREKKGIKAHRHLPEKFSNSDPNEVPLSFRNFYPFPVKLDIIDEIPVQFQKRDFALQLRLDRGGKSQTKYWLYPKTRGEYVFGNIHVYVSSPLGLVKRRFSFEKDQMVKVYPSFIQMRKYSFLSMNAKASFFGLKKVRKIGHTMEFEQIKSYIPGDDIRTINWKATAKTADLMVNQFQDEKAQPIYALIDVGRVMKMPFDNLSLLDYAINSTLSFCNIALKKGDKTGLVTFSHKIHQSLPASNRKTYLMPIMESLYHVKTKYLDTDYGLLYNWVKRKINQRSLLLLFTNFEHISALQRQMPYLKGLAKNHMLIVIFFENTILDELISEPAKNLTEVYTKTIAEKYLYDKKLMVKELEMHGIQAILSKPSDLTVNTINKYLEIKARGIL